MSVWLCRLACPRTRYCHGQPMVWCTFRAAWVCASCEARR